MAEDKGARTSGDAHAAGKNEAQEGAKAAGKKTGGIAENAGEIAGRLLTGLAEKALTAVGEKAGRKVDETAKNLLGKAGKGDGGGPGVQAAISGLGALSDGKGPVRAALSAGMAGVKAKLKGGGGKKKLKLTNIVETIDVGVPIRLAYDQWTQFADFPTFMKKVEQAEASEDVKVHWKAQVFWSHREWEATIVEQVPDSHIIWRSKGAKGHVDGAVTFAELTPSLTRICLVMEYHPQGLFERTGNLWRAQGRRARLELKHFERHLMVHALLEPDEIEGWRGEIRDGEVVRSHEDAMAEQNAEQDTGQDTEQESTAKGRDEEGEPERRGDRDRAAEPGGRTTAEDEGPEPRERRRIRRRAPAEAARQPARRRPADSEERPARTGQGVPRGARG